MIARDFRDHIKALAPWVNWNDTRDHFMHGDPDAAVRGIACTWLATDAVLREAADRDLNFVIAHEGMFYERYSQHSSEQRHHAAKRELIDRLGVTVMRCHDSWDKFPGVGIADKWAEYLGFPRRRRELDSPYVLCDAAGMTGMEVAGVVLSKVRALGQEYVNIMGDLSSNVNCLQKHF